MAENCVISPGKFCDHPAKHYTCEAHNRCVSECWASWSPSREALMAQVEALKKLYDWCMDAGSWSNVSLNPDEGSRWILSAKEYLDFNRLIKEVQDALKPVAVHGLAEENRKLSLMVGQARHVVDRALILIGRNLYRPEVYLPGDTGKYQLAVALQEFKAREEMKPDSIPTAAQDRQLSVDEAVAAEAKRWADRLEVLPVVCDQDGSGTESGDPLDVIEAEINMATGKLVDVLEDLIADPRVAMAIAKDCKGNGCSCLYCRAKELVGVSTD